MKTTHVIKKPNKESACRASYKAPHLWYGVKGTRGCTSNLCTRDKQQVQEEIYECASMGCIEQVNGVPVGVERSCRGWNSNSSGPCALVHSQGLVISPFFCAMSSNCPRESIQNSLMTRCFIELSRFLPTLSVSGIFCSGSAKYRRYSARFVAFISVFPYSVLLSKYSSNAFLISGVNEERGGCRGIVSLNVS